MENDGWTISCSVRCYWVDEDGNECNSPKPKTYSVKFKEAGSSQAKVSSGTYWGSQTITYYNEAVSWCDNDATDDALADYCPATP